MAKYSKGNGHHCFWLKKNGKAIANFDNESDVDAILELERQNAELLRRINNASEALNSESEDCVYDALCHLSGKDYV